MPGPHLSARPTQISRTATRSVQRDGSMKVPSASLHWKTQKLSLCWTEGLAYIKTRRTALVLCGGAAPAGVSRRARSGGGWIWARRGGGDARDISSRDHAPHPRARCVVRDTPSYVGDGYAEADCRQCTALGEPLRTKLPKKSPGQYYDKYEYNQTKVSLGMGRGV